MSTNREERSGQEEQDNYNMHNSGDAFPSSSERTKNYVRSTVASISP